jgi:outer membrane protein TolC
VRFAICDLRFTGGVLLMCLAIFNSAGQETNPGSPIDLPTALRLAGAQNLDVQIARERVREAQANHQSAVAQFFPWISAGIAYRQHDNNIQDVQGNIIDVHKYSYAPGGALNAQVDIGDALFKSLATKQVAHAAEHGLEAQRQESVFAAAQGYFNLALTQGAVGVAAEALRISGDYENQVTRAAEAGLAFKGDVLRARVQKDRNELALRQAREQQRIAAAQLAQTLRLDPSVDLIAAAADLVPLDLVTNTALSALVAQALRANPQLKQSAAFTAAARDGKSSATYGPLIPTVGGTAFWGGLGGGREGAPSTYGGQQDYFVSASWRIGPGGLFDFTRIKATDARLKATELGLEKLKDDLTRQVVESSTRYGSQAEQLATARRALATAEESLRLTQQRKEFAVGIVLENIQAEQDLTRARLDYLKAVAEFNKAQYALSKLTGALATPN